MNNVTIASSGLRLTTAVLVAEREQRGLSQTALAGLLNVHPSYVSLLESGKRQPPYGLLERLAALFSIPVHALMEGQS